MSYNLRDFQQNIYRGFRMLYLKNLLLDMWNNKIWIILIILICAGTGCFIGYKSKVEVKELTALEQAEIDAYYNQIEEYKESVRISGEALEEQAKAVENLQNYADNSIIMRINPESVQVATAQYAINYGENVDWGRVNQGILSYISNGGLREGIENASELEVEYWGDVLGYSIDYNILNLTLNHYDAEKANAIMDVICSRLEAQVPAISEIQGAFSLTLMNRSMLERADNSIMNIQTSNLNNLRNHIQAMAEAENYLFYCRNNLDSYQQNNIPKALSKQSLSSEEGKELLKKYGLLGAVFGLVISIAFFLFCYVTDDRIRDAQELHGTVFNCLGTVKHSVFKPEPKRILMDVQAMVRKAGVNGVFLFDLVGDSASKQAVATLLEEMKQKELPAESGEFVLESAEELEKMISLGTCLVFAEAGKTSLRKLKEYYVLCERYQVKLIGVIVLE